MMTRKEIKQAIEELQEKAAKAGRWETKMVEITKCVGFGMFEGTGKYEARKVWVRNDEEAVEYLVKAVELKNLYEKLYSEEDKKKALKAKIRRYEKELEELEKRREYLKKWLAENE